MHFPRGLLLALLLSPCAFPQQVDPIPLETWRFQNGDNLQWADPTFDDSKWQSSPYPRRFSSGLGMEVYSGIRWYRMTVQIPEAWQNQSLAISLPPLNEVFQVYCNGQLIGGRGTWDSRTGLFPRHLALPVPCQSPEIHIAIRVWKGDTFTNRNALSYDGVGSFTHAPTIGPASLLLTTEQLHAYTAAWVYLLNLAGRGLLVVIGLASLALFLVAGRHAENLWLAITLLTSGLPYLAGVVIANSDLPLRSPLAGLVVFLQYGSYATMSVFLATICPRLHKPLLLTAAVQTLLALSSAVAYTTQIQLPESADLSVYIGMAVCLLVTGVLLTEKRGSLSGLLAFALTASVLSDVWSVRLVYWLGLPASFRYPNIAGFAVDVRILTQLLFAFLALAGLYLRLRAERDRQERVNRDLDAARLIQESLIGTSIADTPGFTVDAAYLPASEVGGDFYQSIPGPDGSLLLVTGDVSGKGLPASLLVAATLGALGSTPSRQPATVLAHLNRTLQGKTRGGFVTCIAALFRPDGRVQLANAGHLPPYVDGQEVEIESGLPLGMIADAEYDEISLTAASLTFVSDGVVEAANAAGELFGFARTAAIAAQPAKAIAEAARSWGQNDDITVVTVRRSA